MILLFISASNACSFSISNILNILMPHIVSETTVARNNKLITSPFLIYGIIDTGGNPGDLEHVSGPGQASYLPDRVLVFKDKSALPTNTQIIHIFQSAIGYEKCQILGSKNRCTLK